MAYNSITAFLWLIINLVLNILLKETPNTLTFCLKTILSKMFNFVQELKKL